MRRKKLGGAGVLKRSENQASGMGKGAEGTKPRMASAHDIPSHRYEKVVGSSVREGCCRGEKNTYSGVPAPFMCPHSRGGEIIFLVFF